MRITTPSTSLLFCLLFVLAGCSVPNKPGLPNSFSGTINRDQEWSGNVSVTGDITVKRGVTLTVLPGTIVTITAFSDDQSGGTNHPHDPPFPKDPDRKETTSTVIQIDGILNASGTPEQRIVFTTDKKQTTYDWDGLVIAHGKLDYAVVEHARYNRIQQSSDVVISNSIIRNSLECCLCIGHAKPVSPTIVNNDIYNCGHEGIDNAGGAAVIKGNYFHVENPEIQPEPNWGKVGIVIYQNTHPLVENNRFEKLQWALLFSDNAIHKNDGVAIVRNNEIKNNEVAFSRSRGYPKNAVLIENNNLTNNTQEEFIDE